MARERASARPIDAENVRAPDDDAGMAGDEETDCATAAAGREAQVPHREPPPEKVPPPKRPPGPGEPIDEPDEPEPIEDPDEPEPPLEEPPREPEPPPPTHIAA